MKVSESAEDQPSFGLDQKFGDKAVSISETQIKQS